MPMKLDVFLKDKNVQNSTYKPIDEIKKEDLSFPIDIAIKEKLLKIVIVSLCQNKHAINISINEQGYLDISFNENESCPKCPGCDYKETRSEKYDLEHSLANSYNYSFSFKLGFKYYHDRITAELNKGMLIIKVPVIEGIDLLKIPIK